MRFTVVIILIAVASFLVTFILHRMFTKKRYIKYIPVILLVPFMLYNFVTMNSPLNEGFEDLGKFVMGVFLLAAILSALLSSIAFDLYRLLRKR